MQYVIMLWLTPNPSFDLMRPEDIKGWFMELNPSVGAITDVQIVEEHDDSQD